MGEIKCRKCGDSFSSSLRECPNCGEPNIEHKATIKTYNSVSRTYSSSSTDTFVSFSNAIAWVLLIGGVIGSIVAAAILGKESGYFHGHYEYREWGRTIAIFIGGTLASCISFIAIKGLSLIVDLLSTIKEKID